LNVARYQPSNRLYLGLLTRPQLPVLYAEQIDRPFLRDQRKQLESGR
jgi:hypothetical protein